MADTLSSPPLPLAVSLWDAGPPQSCPAPFNLAADVLACTVESPAKVALAIVTPQGSERWSFARLEAAVRGTAAGLAQCGLAPGTRVVLRLGNTVDFPITFLGAIAADLVPVATSAQLTTAELDAMLPALNPALILAGRGIALPSAPGCPVLDEGDLAAMRDLAPADYALGDPERPGYIVFTSGSSGRTRAVVHAHRAVRARRMMWTGWYDLHADDRVMHAGSFNWTYTLGTGLMDPWATGATALIPGPGADRHSLPLLLRRHDATIFAAVPGVLRQILEAGTPLDLPRLRHTLVAGEALPPALRAAWEAATGRPVHEALGLSEVSTFVSGSPARPAPMGSIGYPQPGRRIAVLSEEGTEPLPCGVPGILAVSCRDPGLTLGYDGAEDETRARFRGEWFVTGDVVSMASDGAITYHGRADDMMNAGGFRVAPAEVEAALTAHPGVSEAAAVTLPIRDGVEVIAAFYVAASPLREEELAAWCATRLARYKCPRLFLPADALPRGANGKLLRRKLREDWSTQRQGDTA